eukprot:CAMPEP_0170483504 /NCGR_PEP_ID=MMETSP0208-20121228/3173_1 /TAXON_ID=197538 /ORGANISM="Strombidium inclinatum, Strain S3" /LENGTH=72 /DNA_ID=CAMNT_0010756567 /DNA_START=85 /DNA_END=303 /DNA_ORIENTATION=+
MAKQPLLDSPSKKPVCASKCSKEKLYLLLRPEELDSDSEEEESDEWGSVDTWGTDSMSIEEYANEKAWFKTL